MEIKSHLRIEVIVIVEGQISEDSYHEDKD